VVARNRLLFGLLMHFAWTTGLFAVPVAVHGQYSLPEFTLPSPPKGATAPSIDKLKAKNWVRPLHPSLVGKSRAEFALQSAGASNIPLWTGSDDNYTFQMVG
jgi:hypothetical protein